MAPGEPIPYSEGQPPVPTLGGMVSRGQMILLHLFFKEKLEVWFLLILMIVILCPGLIYSLECWFHDSFLSSFFDGVWV